MCPECVNYPMYALPDTNKVINGTYQLKYFNGLLIFDNVRKVKYIPKLRGTSTLPNMLDTLITFDGKDMIFPLKF